VPPYSSLIYKESDIVPHLTKLILENSHVERWVFKIDNEFAGRGIAFFDASGTQVLT
jgi:hypothetical protein